MKVKLKNTPKYVHNENSAVVQSAGLWLLNALKTKALCIYIKKNVRNIAPLPIRVLSMDKHPLKVSLQQMYT